MELIKLVTMRMTMEDRLYMTFFGPIVANNGESVNKTIKRETNQLIEAAYTQERQDPGIN